MKTAILLLSVVLTVNNASEVETGAKSRAETGENELHVINKCLLNALE